VSATVDSNESGNYNPDVVAATAVSPSSEHIPVTRRRASRKSLQFRERGMTRLARAVCSAGRLSAILFPAGRSMKCS